MLNNIFKSMFYLLIIGVACYQYSVNKSLEAQLQKTQKIYVYNLNEVLLGIGATEINKKLETDIKKLSEDALKTENKIKNLKSAQVKEDFSEVYLNSIRLKRDALLDDYQKTMDELGAKINLSLEKMAQKYEAPTIFSTKTIKINTPKVIDLTNEIISDIKQN